MVPRLLKMSDVPFSRAPIVLTTAAAATFVTLPASSRYFTPFLARERSASQVARELGVDIGSVTYRIRQMLALDLIGLTRRTARAGRAIQYYRSSADAVFAPLDLTPIATVRELFQRSRVDSQNNLEASGERAWLRVGGNQRWGTHLYRDNPEGPPNRDFVPQGLTTSSAFWSAVLASSGPAVWDQHAFVTLTRARAKELQHELAALVDRYSTASTTDTPTSQYLVHLRLAPDDSTH
jgi:hypothetical protein